MGQLGSYGDLGGSEIQEGFELRPPGEYPVKVTDSDVYQKNGNLILKLEFEILDGKPGKIWEYLSFSNNPTKNGKTVAEISQSKLKTIATYGGHRNPNNIADSEELHGLEMVGKIKIEEDPTGKYGSKNRISGFMAKSGTTAQQAVVQPTVPAPAPVQAETMPWE